MESNVIQMNGVQAVTKKPPKQDFSEEVLKDLLNELNISVRDNLITHEMEVTGMPEKYSKEKASVLLATFLKNEMRDRGIKIPSDLEKQIELIANEHHYNPLTDAIEAAPWSGTDRLAEACSIMGIVDEQHKLRLRKWLHQAIALAYNDGTVAAEGVLVLQGGQGIGKTRFCRVLAIKKGWLNEGATINLFDKDSKIEAVSTPFTELGELDFTLDRRQSGLKGFLTSPTDRIRMPYSPTWVKTPRHTSFCATVNPTEFLVDETGNRRFWTIPIVKVDKKALEKIENDDGWALDLYRQIKTQYYDQDPRGFYLTDAERAALDEENGEYEKEPEDGRREILDAVNFNLPQSQWPWVTASQMKSLAGISKDAKRIGKALTALCQRYGWPIEKDTHNKTCRYKVPIENTFQAGRLSSKNNL